jgi:hypothetical protein
MQTEIILQQYSLSIYYNGFQFLEFTEHIDWTKIYYIRLVKGFHYAKFKIRNILGFSFRYFL